LSNVVFQPPAHYAIAIAASTGGVIALPKLLGSLPPHLNASIFVVQHLSPHHVSNLRHILQRSTSLPCLDGAHMRFHERGHVYIAPPDRHLHIDRRHMLLSSAQKVCHVRPSADVLFESVAEAFGGRAIGVVLTGRLNDGTRGLAAIKSRGGIAIVQEPCEADAAGMPQSALRSVPVDFRLPLNAIGPILEQLSSAVFSNPANVLA
jgi:two-component system, chemotaxis family, protein-glutamate methylesterase/glutaminase